MVNTLITPIYKLSTKLLRSPAARLLLLLGEGLALHVAVARAPPHGAVLDPVLGAQVEPVVAVAEVPREQEVDEEAAL